MEIDNDEDSISIVINYDANESNQNLIAKNELGESMKGFSDSMNQRSRKGEGKIHIIGNEKWAMSL